MSSPENNMQTSLVTPPWFMKALVRVENLLLDSGAELVADRRNYPLELVCGLAMLGGHMPLDPACEEPIIRRLAPVYKRYQARGFVDVREVIGCLYECHMYAKMWQAGFAPSFLSPKNAEFVSESHRILFECKDIRHEHALIRDHARTTRNLADHIRRAGDQTRAHDPEGRYLHVAFIDLPEGAHAWLTEMSDEQRYLFWRDSMLIDGSPDFKPDVWNTFFTAFDTLHTPGDHPAGRTLEAVIVHPVALNMKMDIRLAEATNMIYHAFGTSPFGHLWERESAE